MKKINISIVLGLVFAIALSFARFDAACQNIRDNVFRLHIKANSNSTDDQNLKLMIRDAILLEKGEAFGQCENLNSAIEYAENNIEQFRNITLTVINEQGYDYDVKVSVGNSYFDNREYDDFTLPAGNYQALNITIGNGRGHNWWCVMFPAVCIGASGELSDSVSKEGTEIAEHSEKYVIKFKTVEIYEDIKNFFAKSKK